MKRALLVLALLALAALPTLVYEHRPGAQGLPIQPTGWTSCTPWSSSEPFAGVDGQYYQPPGTGDMCIIGGKPHVWARGYYDWLFHWAQPDWDVRP